jgi:hypothetical protein
MDFVFQARYNAPRPALHLQGIGGADGDRNHKKNTKPQIAALMFSVDDVM